MEMSAPCSPPSPSGLHFPDPFFHNAQPWMAALGVTLLAVVALLLLAVYLLKVRGKGLAQGLAWGWCLSCLGHLWFWWRRGAGKWLGGA